VKQARCRATPAATRRHAPPRAGVAAHRVALAPIRSRSPRTRVFTQWPEVCNANDMLDTPARSEDVRTMLDDVDDETVQRILETGASIDEIAEAMHLVENNVSSEEVATTARVEEVREILTASRDKAGGATWTAW
jgi:hypothetical protein